MGPKDKPKLAINIIKPMMIRTFPALPLEFLMVKPMATNEIEMVDTTHPHCSIILRPNLAKRVVEIRAAMTCSKLRIAGMTLESSGTIELMI